MWLERTDINPVKSLLKEAVLRWSQPSIAALIGDRRSFFLAHSWVAVHYLSGKRIRIIDCAVRFDSNFLVDECMRYGLDVDEALLSMHIRRAFTPYQILEALHEIETEKNWANDIFYLLAPYKQFFDGDVAADEAAYLLHMLNEKIRVLGKHGVAMLVVEKSHYSNAAFAPAMHQLKQIVNPLWQIIPIHSPTGDTTVLRSHWRQPAIAANQDNHLFGDTHGKNHRPLPKSNAVGRASPQLVSARFAS